MVNCFDNVSPARLSAVAWSEIADFRFSLPSRDEGSQQLRESTGQHLIKEAL